jgi:hypothetical protein
LASSYPGLDPLLQLVNPHASIPNLVLDSFVAPTTNEKRTFI